MYRERALEGLKGRWGAWDTGMWSLAVGNRYQCMISPFYTPYHSVILRSSSRPCRNNLVADPAIVVHAATPLSLAVSAAGMDCPRI